MCGGVKKGLRGWPKPPSQASSFVDFGSATYIPPPAILFSPSDTPFRFLLI